MPEAIKNPNPALPDAKSAEAVAPKTAKTSFMQTWFLQYYKLATAGVCFIVLAAGYWFIISPKIDSAQNIATTVLQEEQDKEAALKKRIEYLVNLESARSQIPDEDIRRINDMLPSEPGIPELLASLESIATASFVKLESIQFSKVAAAAPGDKNKASTLPGGAQGLEIQLTVANTPYSNVKTLVSNIEKSLRLLDVAALIYSPGAKSYSLTARSYYLP